ncbi:hypothetical protein J2S09_005498 [Bacillus fengqiuensis]|nr:hypothetical protein [Bacillus fengqiuensis]
MIPKWFFLIFISNFLFINCEIVNAEDTPQVNKPSVIDSKQEKLRYDIVILNEKLDSLYKKREALSEAMLETDKEIFEVQKMIIEKSIDGN